MEGRSAFSIIIRVAAGAYLVYLGVSLIQSYLAEGVEAWTVAFGIVFIIVGAGVALWSLKSVATRNLAIDPEKRRQLLEEREARRAEEEANKAKAMGTFFKYDNPEVEETDSSEE